MFPALEAPWTLRTADPPALDPLTWTPIPLLTVPVSPTVERVWMAPVAVDPARKLRSPPLTRKSVVELPPVTLVVPETISKPPAPPTDPASMLKTEPAPIVVAAWAENAPELLIVPLKVRRPPVPTTVRISPPARLLIVPLAVTFHARPVESSQRSPPLSIVVKLKTDDPAVVVPRSLTHPSGFVLSMWLLKEFVPSIWRMPELPRVKVVPVRVEFRNRAVPIDWVHWSMLWFLPTDVIVWMSEP